MRCPDFCGWYIFFHVEIAWDEDMLLVVDEDNV